MFTEKELINLPRLAIGIPVAHNAAACLMHLLRNGIGNIEISLEDLRVEGATLILSSHIQLAPNELIEQLDHDVQLEQEEKMKHLKEFWDDYMEEQKQKLGLNNTLTLEQIKKTNQLIDEERIKFASENYWSDETNEYCEQFEDEIFADGLFDSIDVWGEDEEDD